MLEDIYPAQWASQLAVMALARAAVTAEHEHRSQELLNTVITRLFHVGLSLQATTDLPAEVTRQRIAEALGHLDDTIREIRDTAFTQGGH